MRHTIRDRSNREPSCEERTSALRAVPALAEFDDRRAGAHRAPRHRGPPSGGVGAPAPGSIVRQAFVVLDGVVIDQPSVAASRWPEPATAWASRPSADRVAHASSKVVAHTDVRVLVFGPLELADMATIERIAPAPCRCGPSRARRALHRVAGSRVGPAAFGDRLTCRPAGSCAPPSVVGIAAVVLVDVAVLGVDVFLLSNRSTTTVVDLQDALVDFREGLDDPDLGHLGAGGRRRGDRPHGGSAAGRGERPPRRHAPARRQAPRADDAHASSAAPGAFGLPARGRLRVPHGRRRDGVDPRRAPRVPRRRPTRRCATPAAAVGRSAPR